MGKHGQTALEKLFGNTVVNDETGCWEWQRGLVTGYGKLHAEGRWWLAHRLGWERLVGRVPPGLDLDHLCRNRKCWNPSHLEPVTRQENLRRSSETQATKNATKTHCLRGHAFTLENTGYKRSGWRYCKECQRDKAGECMATDHTSNELRHLLRWYEAKELQSPGGLTSTADVIADIKNVLSDAAQLRMIYGDDYVGCQPDE